jgi:hypothetical protein
VGKMKLSEVNSFSRKEISKQAYLTSDPMFLPIILCFSTATLSGNLHGWYGKIFSS